MLIQKKIFIVLLSILVVGCSSTGGTIGGLFPAPKILDGKIENDVYFSKNNDFTVSIPHKDGTYEFTYLQIKEQYNELGTYISFGPAAFDQSIYRLEIGRKLSPESQEVDFTYAVDTVIANYSKQLESSYKSKSTFIKKNKAIINGFESFVVNLEQNVSNQILEHEVIVINYPTMAAIFWVQKLSGRAQKATINALEFAQSFKVL
jgi:hypothetical protein